MILYHYIIISDIISLSVVLSLEVATAPSNRVTLCNLVTFHIGGIFSRFVTIDDQSIKRIKAHAIVTRFYYPLVLNFAIDNLLVRFFIKISNKL